VRIVHEKYAEVLAAPMPSGVLHIAATAAGRIQTAQPNELPVGPAGVLHRVGGDPILYIMAQDPEPLDPTERAREKQLSREEDARALASGAKSRAQIRRENGLFVFRNVRVSLRGAKPLE
jgi:hypothetical protein